MMTKGEFPILEYDTERVAKLNPGTIAGQGLGAGRLVITFFPEVVAKLAAAGEIVPHHEIGGENPFTVYRFADDPDVLIVLGQVGCPACGGNLDLLHAMGVTKVVFCGGGGVLDSRIDVGRLMLVDGAIRDEGFSYHYVEPSRIIYTDKQVTDKMAASLERRGIPYFRGLCWTTDALFRETEERVARRREEGASVVEMEQAGCIAVARFRGFDYGAVIYGGDDVASEEWQHRGWNTRQGMRYNLVMLCRDLVQEL